jgi:hypothetical protein
MNLRKKEIVENLKRRHQIALCRILAWEVAMDLL